MDLDKRRIGIRSLLNDQGRVFFIIGQRFDEQIAELLVDADIEQHVVADPGEAAPFRAGSQKVAIGKADCRIEGRSLAEIGRQGHPGHEIFLAGAAALGIDDQRIAGGLDIDAVIDPVEGIELENLRHVVGHAAAIEPVAGKCRDQRCDGAIGNDRGVDQLDRIDANGGRVGACLAFGEIGRPLRIADRKRRQFVADFLRGFATALDAEFVIVEAGHRKSGDIGIDQHVAPGNRGTLAPNRVPAEQRLHLRQYVDGAVDPVGRGARRFPDIDGDDDIDPHGARRVDRQIVGDHAIDKQQAFALDRRETGRDRHAGEDRSRQIAAAHHDRAAGDDVGSNGAERNRQPVEIFGRAPWCQDFLDGGEKALAAEHTPGQRRLAIDQPEARIEQDIANLALAPERQVVAAQPVIEHRFPVDAAGDRPDLAGVVADGVHAADDGAHAGPRNDIDGNVAALKFRDDADMGKTLGAAAAEHQADTRTTISSESRRRCRLRRGRTRQCQRRNRHGQDDRQCSNPRHFDLIPCPDAAIVQIQAGSAASTPSAPAPRWRGRASLATPTAFRECRAR